jgi:hypothetical protein
VQYTLDTPYCKTIVVYGTVTDSDVEKFQVLYNGAIAALFLISLALSKLTDL